MAPAAKCLLADNVAPHLSTLTAVFPVNACCRKTATTMNNPASAGHLLISDDGVFLNNVLHQSRMKEWRNISEKKLVDANIFEGGLEALVGEVAAKAAPLRSSSKRSRAAEVHNLSEKRSDGGGGRGCCSGDIGSNEDGEALDRFSARSRRGSPALHGLYDAVLRVRLKRLQEQLYVRCNYS